MHGSCFQLSSRTQETNHDWIMSRALGGSDRRSTFQYAIGELRPAALNDAQLDAAPFPEGLNSSRKVDYLYKYSWILIFKTCVVPKLSLSYSAASK